MYYIIFCLFISRRGTPIGRQLTPVSPVGVHSPADSWDYTMGDGGSCGGGGGRGGGSLSSNSQGGGGGGDDGIGCDFDAVTSRGGDG